MLLTSLFRFLSIIAILVCSFHGIAQQPYKGSSQKFTRLVWADEFNKNGLPDSTSWSYEKGYIRNKELQFYTSSRSENIAVKNGMLHIVVRRDSLHIDTAIFPVTSASIVTKGKKQWTYGRIEARAKVPSSLGTWPAIWTLGSNIDTVDWPHCGEIDILEHVGYMPDTLHFNVHTGRYNHVKRTNKGARIFYKAPHSGFHIYAIEWFSDKIDWYFDDRKVFSFKNEKTDAEAWPFDKPQYLILNLALGGAWGGSKGVDLNSLPQTFLIDYVRVFQ